jgi:hypothetical protein
MSEALTNQIMATSQARNQGGVVLYSWPPGQPQAQHVSGTTTWHLVIVNSYNQAIKNVSIKLPPEVNPPNKSMTFGNPQVTTKIIPAGGMSFASVDVKTDNTAPTTYTVTFVVDFEFVTPSQGTSVATTIIVS